MLFFSVLWYNQNAQKEKKMIVTVVCDVLGKENNGATIAGMNLIRFLKKQGHEVRILCADQDKKGQEGYYVCPALHLGKWLDSLVAKVGVTIAKKDMKTIEEAITGADIIHLHVPFSLAKNAAKLAEKMNIPMTASFHMQAENLTSYFKLNKSHLANHMVYKIIYKNVYRHVGGIHYPTEFIKNKFEGSIKKKTPAYVISNGVNSHVKKMDIEKPEEFKDKIVILSVGRLAREKSQDTLLKAVNYSKYKDKIQVILAGQGLKEKYYRKLGEKLPIKPIMQLFPRDEIVKVINYADLYVHSAEVELEGIACLEAIACGKMTIVSDSKQSATKEFAIDEKCIFKNRNPKDLARVIDYWIEHPEEKKEYEKKYLEGATIYNQDDCMKRMEEMLFEVIEKNKEKLKKQKETEQTKKKKKAAK